MKKQGDDCLSYEAIERYVNNLDDMTDEDIFAVSDHLYNCDHCSELARGIRIFDFLLEGWTAETHGTAYKLASADTWSNLDFLTPGRLIAAVRVIVKKPGEVMQLLTENIVSKIGFSPDLNFAACTGSRGASAGTTDKAANKVMALSETGKEIILVSGTHSGLKVRLEGFNEQDGLEVLLHTEGHEPVVGVLIPEEESEGCWNVVFTDIPKGEYILIFKSKKVIR